MFERDSSNISLHLIVYPKVVKLTTTGREDGRGFVEKMATIGRGDENLPQPLTDCTAFVSTSDPCFLAERLAPLRSVFAVTAVRNYFHWKMRDTLILDWDQALL